MYSNKSMISYCRNKNQSRRCHTIYFFFQAEDGIRDYKVTGVQTCALPILVQVERIVLLLHLHVREEVLDQLLGPERPAAVLEADQQARSLEHALHAARLVAAQSDAAGGRLRRGVPPAGAPPLSGRGRPPGGGRRE